MPDPVPGDGDLLIEVRATTVTTGDARVRALRMPSPLFQLMARPALGFRGPRRKILGTEASGLVKAVGRNVTSWRVGDHIVAVVGAKFGAHAELLCVPATTAVVKLPDSITFEEAVAIPFGGLTALYYLRHLGDVGPGTRVLVVGASGAVGVAAVQLAAHLGATVDGVCSTNNIALVRSLGATRVYDYAHEDFTHGDDRYDVVFDTVGVTSPARCRAILTPRGRFLAAVVTGGLILQSIWTKVFGGQRVFGGITPERKADLEWLFSLVESGHLKPVIDRVYSMDQIEAAHRRVDSCRKVGTVVVRVGSDSDRHEKTR